MPQILIVEDEAAIADTLIFALQSEGFSTHWLTLASAALAYQQATPADLWILDVGLPDLSGFEACKQLRRFSEVPVLFLTARNAEIDRVVGLEIGADDYVVKPFSPREVAARVKAILKRVAPRETPAAPHLGHGSGALVKRHSMTARSAQRCCPVAVRPRLFSWQKLERSGLEKVRLFTSGA